MRHHPWRAGLMFAVLALLGLGANVALAEQRPFEAEGIGYIVDSQGNRLTLVASGTAAHLGEWEGVFEITVWGNRSRVVGALEGANGDSLDVVNETVFDPTLPGQVGTFTIVGGAGRFRGATGGGSFGAVITSFDPVETLELTFDGTIDY